jgi:hypothetical protein
MRSQESAVEGCEYYLAVKMAANTEAISAKLPASGNKNVTAHRQNPSYRW